MTNSYAAEVAITIDDPNVETKPLFNAQDRDHKILTALKNNGNLKAVLFVCGMRIDNPLGKILLQDWNNAGHILGNHTYSHLSFNSITEKQLEADTRKNENLISSYSNFHKIFRFPFLKEGETTAQRDAFRDFLQKENYSNGRVTIDASDWYISERLEQRLTTNPNADISGFRKYYLDHIWSRSQYYDNLAKQVLGRSPKHVLLIHHNLLNALFLGDLIQMFKQKGWHVIDADTAFADPIYKLQPDIVPAGESLIWALAKQTGRYNNKLRYPGEDAVYEKDSMDKLGL